MIAIEAYRFRERRYSMLQEDPLFRLDLSLELAHSLRAALPRDVHAHWAVIAPSPLTMDRPR